MLFVLTAMVAWSRALPGCHFGLFQGNRNIVAEPAPFSRLERDCLHHYRRGGRPCPLIGNRGAGTGRRREKWRGENNMVRDNAQIPPMFDDSTIFVCRNKKLESNPGRFTYSASATASTKRFFWLLLPLAIVPALTDSRLSLFN